MIAECGLGAHHARLRQRSIGALRESRSFMHDAVRVLVRGRLIERVAGNTLPAFTTSFGVSDSTMAEAFDTILNRADEALLRAKQGGRNRVESDHAQSEKTALQSSTATRVVAFDDRRGEIFEVPLGVAVCG